MVFLGKQFRDQITVKFPITYIIPGNSLEAIKASGECDTKFFRLIKRRNKKPQQVEHKTRKITPDK